MNEPKVECECHPPRDLAAGEFYGRVVRRQTSPQFLISEVHHDCGRTLPAHAHRAAYFSLLVEGGYAERYEGRRYEYDPLTVWWHRPGVVHDDAVGHKGGRFMNVELTSEGMASLADAGLARRDFHERGTEVVWLACRLLRELRHWQPCSGLVAEHLALEMAGSALRHREPPASARPMWLNRVSDKLHSEPNRRHYTSALADEAGVHPVYLASMFRRFYRKTIGEYLRELRVRQAADLLRGGDMPLVQMAVTLGFADQAHFTRIFGHEVGMPPNVFRRLLRPASEVLGG